MWHREGVEVNGPSDAAWRLTLTGRTTYTGANQTRAMQRSKVTGRTTGRITLVVCIAIAVFAAWKLGLFDLTSRERLTDIVGRVQAVGFLKLAFVGVYALTSAIGVPASALTLAGGALFGVTRGLALNWLGAMAGALLAFQGTRLLSGPASEWLRSRVGDRLTGLASSGGFASLLSLRAIPVVPFALLNVGSALFGMKLRVYLAATALGILPITIVYTVLATSLMAGVEGSGRRALVSATISGLAVIALSFAPALIRRHGRQGTR